MPTRNSPPPYFVPLRAPSDVIEPEKKANGRDKNRRSVFDPKTNSCFEFGQSDNLRKWKSTSGCRGGSFETTPLSCGCLHSQERTATEQDRKVIPKSIFVFDALHFGFRVVFVEILPSSARPLVHRALLSWSTQPPILKKVPFKVSMPSMSTGKESAQTKKCGNQQQTHFRY